MNERNFDQYFKKKFKFPSFDLGMHVFISRFDYCFHFVETGV